MPDASLIAREHAFCYASHQPAGVSPLLAQRASSKMFMESCWQWGGAASACAVGIDAESDKIDLLLKEVEGKDVNQLISEGEALAGGFLCEAFTRCIHRQKSASTFRGS